MTGWTEEDGLSWRALEPFGFEVDADLAAPLAPETAARLIALYREDGLILARGQALTTDQQIALMSRVGPVLHKIDGIGVISTDQTYKGAHSELTFHSDYAFTEYPLIAISLHALEAAPGAATTRFASADRAYQRLPAELRARLEAHRAQLISPNPTAFAARTFEVREPDAMMSEIRPSVIAHPQTGRPCVHVSELHAARLLDMTWEESRDLLGAVYDVLYAPQNVYEHSWSVGDLIFWDNISLQHARGQLSTAARRVLQRVACGEKGVDELCLGILENSARPAADVLGLGAGP